MLLTMATYEEQIFPGFAEALQSSRPASPASRLPLPGSDEARAMTAGSGTQCSMLLEVSSPLGRFSKILMASSLWTNSAEYCYVWTHLPTRFGCSGFQLTQLEPSTDDTESSLLDAITAKWNSGPNAHTKGVKQTLNRLLPTPTIPNGGRVNPPETTLTGAHPDGRKRQIDLREAVKKLWPTPTAITDTGGAALCKWGGRGARKKLKQMVDSETLNGSLNPRFVEELMGFPIDHTALKLSATPLCPSKPILSLEPYG